MRARSSVDDARALGSCGGADKRLRHAVEKLADAGSAGLGDGGSALGEIGLSIGLRL